jgi:hypothetical protein
MVFLFKTKRLLRVIVFMIPSYIGFLKPFVSQSKDMNLQEVDEVI